MAPARWAEEGLLQTTDRQSSRRGWTWLIVALVIGGLTVPTAAAAQTDLYGVNFEGLLLRINETTGTAVVICTLPFPATEIIFDNSTDRWFAQLPDGGFAIFQFSLQFGGTCPLVSGVDDGHSFTGLAYVGSTLYGTGIDASGGPSTLYTLDPVTGASVAIGLTGVGPISGIAYDATGGIMYGIAGGPGPANLYRINLVTGVATVIGSTGIQAGSLRFGTGGVLLAGSTGPSGGRLYAINPATGASTLVGNTGFETLNGLTLGPHIDGVPTLSQWGMTLLALVQLAGGAWHVSRSRPATLR